MIRFICHLSAAALLMIGSGQFQPADAADPPSHVLRKANAGCPTDILIAQPGAPKATQATKSPAQTVVTDAEVGSQGSTTAIESTVELVPLPGLQKPAGDAPPAAPGKDTDSAAPVVRGETADADDDRIMILSQLTCKEKQEIDGPSTADARPPQLFRWHIARPTIETLQQSPTARMTTAMPQQRVAVHAQRRPNSATDTAPQLQLLGPLNTGAAERRVVVSVQAEVDATASTTGGIAQAEASEGGPTPAADLVPEAGAEVPLVMEGQFIEEPGPYAYGVYQPGCPPYPLNQSWSIPWEVFAQGEYIGPARTPHVPEYRLRVDDQLEFIYRLDGQKSPSAYRINVGDNLQIESLTADNLNRQVLVQPDGTISLRQLGQVPAAGRTVNELREDLDARYSEYVQNPTMSVIPLTVNTTLEELRATVDNRYGTGGQSRLVRVTPEGTVQLPAIGSIPVHGLTLDEVGFEVELRYASIVEGLQVTPVLFQRAPRYVYVVGEVAAPGRYTLEGPTSLMQAIALAGGWNVGGNLHQVVVFRRDENWRLLACKLDIRAPLYGKELCPQGDIWLRDSDIVVVPKCKMLVADDFIELVFTRGIYGVFPFGGNISFVRQLSSVAGGVSVIPAAP